MSGGTAANLGAGCGDIAEDAVVEGPGVDLAVGSVRVGLDAGDDGVGEFAGDVELGAWVGDEENARESEGSGGLKWRARTSDVSCCVVIVGFLKDVGSWCRLLYSCT